jgi:hypothetical protein
MVSGVPFFLSPRPFCRDVLFFQQICEQKRQRKRRRRAGLRDRKEKERERMSFFFGVGLFFAGREKAGKANEVFPLFFFRAHAARALTRVPGGATMAALIAR